MEPPVEDRQKPKEQGGARGGEPDDRDARGTRSWDGGEQGPSQSEDGRK